MRVLIPLPDRDFDPTEVVQPWDALSKAGIEVVFATQTGAAGACDPKLMTGVIFGKLGALPGNIALYRELEKTRPFAAPLPFAQVKAADYAAISLPGGHAKGMRAYLESTALQEVVRGFFREKRIVASICHGGVVLARTLDPSTGKSVVRGRTMTALNKIMERSAYYLTAWKLGGYYRTYPEYVQDEVVRALGSRRLFRMGPIVPSYGKPFTVRDGDLLTARWPGDAAAYAAALVGMLRERGA